MPILPNVINLCREFPADVQRQLDEALVWVEPMGKQQLQGFRVCMRSPSGIMDYLTKYTPASTNQPGRWEPRFKDETMLFTCREFAFEAAAVMVLDEDASGELLARRRKHKAAVDDLEVIHAELDKRRITFTHTADIELDTTVYARRQAEHVELFIYDNKTSYDIPYRRMDTPEKLLGWLHHLAEKDAFTNDHMRALINVACAGGVPVDFDA